MTPQKQPLVPCVWATKITPPASMLYLKEADGVKRAVDPVVGERPKNWLVRSFPNLYPAFVSP